VSRLPRERGRPARSCRQPRLRPPVERVSVRRRENGRSDDLTPRLLGLSVVEGVDVLRAVIQIR